MVNPGRPCIAAVRDGGSATSMLEFRDKIEQLKG
jgi:hypothetical protein